MRPIRFAIQPLLDLFERLGAVTMAQMKGALGNPSGCDRLPQTLNPLLSE